MSDAIKQMERFVDGAYSRLDTVTYYQLLSLDPKASLDDIKQVYYKYARRLHPDLYGKKADPEFKRKLTAVYSRVVEAYKVLSDAKRRRLYDRRLRRGENRLSADIEAAPKKNKTPADRIRNPHAKKFYELAMAALEKNDKKTAVMNLKLALSAEPRSFVIKKALLEAGK